MDWSEERYVRLYVRDTTTWKLLRWQGQCVLALMLRKLNRAGHMDLAGCTPAEAVELHTDLPSEVSEPGMEACLKRGVFVQEGDTLVMPNYVKAQEAQPSAAQRKRESRARAKAMAAAGVTKCDMPGTDRDQTVTLGHTESHAVTPSLAEPSLAEPSRTPTEGSGALLRGMAEAFRELTRRDDFKHEPWTGTEVQCLREMRATCGDLPTFRAKLSAVMSADGDFAIRQRLTWWTDAVKRPLEAPKAHVPGGLEDVKRRMRDEVICEY